jgi:hypothetical protein
MPIAYQVNFVFQASHPTKSSHPGYGRQKYCMDALLYLASVKQSLQITATYFEVGLISDEK